MFKWPVSVGRKRDYPTITFAEFQESTENFVPAYFPLLEAEQLVALYTAEAIGNGQMEKETNDDTNARRVIDG